MLGNSVGRVMLEKSAGQGALKSPFLGDPNYLMDWKTGNIVRCVKSIDTARREKEREVKGKAIGQIAPDLASCTTEHYSLREGS